MSQTLHDSPVGDQSHKIFHPTHACPIQKIHDFKDPLANFN
jgi:hypothetical protein